MAALELVIHTDARGRPHASGRYMPRRPRDIALFHPTASVGLTFAELQEQLFALEQRAAEEAAAPARQRRPVMQRSASSGVVGERTARPAAEQLNQSMRQPPAGTASGGTLALKRSTSVASSAAARAARAALAPPSPKAAPVVVDCENPYCKRTLVLQAAQGRPPPPPPEGNWFCQTCTTEARERGVKLFERVTTTRRIRVGARSITQYLVKYWEVEDCEWLGHEEMQSLEVSFNGV
jgi:hypothetical protein